jgi:hypothetical protein
VGEFSRSAARRLISFGNVAEKRRFWRFCGGQVDGLLLQVIEQAPGRGDHDVDTPAQFRNLCIDADAAKDLSHPEWQVAAVGAHALTDLRGKLARGRENQDPHAPPAGARILQSLQQRQSEAGRLAGAGLSAGQDVPAVEDLWNRLLLDRGRMKVSLVIDRAQQFGRQAELIEKH